MRSDKNEILMTIMNRMICHVKFTTLHVQIFENIRVCLKIGQLEIDLPIYSLQFYSQGFLA